MASTEGKWFVERRDQDDGSITYEVIANGYVFVFAINDADDDEYSSARDNAELIVRAVNHLRGF